MRRSDLVRTLAGLSPFERPDPAREQLATPPEAAATLLESAVANDDLVGRSVLDLGAGTGLLSIGAALLGAGRVVAIEIDPAAAAAARAAARRLSLAVEVRVGRVSDARTPVDTVVMNPPFGAQRKGADRPFWERAMALADRAVYAFASVESRSFIAGKAVARPAYVESVRPVPWELERTFPHHRQRRVPIPVDLWVIRTKERR